MLRRELVRQRTLVLVTAVTLLGAGGRPALGNPEGATVVAGAATVSAPTAQLTEIRQSTDRAIVEWQSFSNAPGETVRFQQPGPASATLNRVTGPQGSVIRGAMEANGSVWLINRNGVLFGPTAHVQVGGLVASTLDASNAGFLAGTAELSRPPGARAGAVVNQGRIATPPGGHVALVGGVVESSGTIHAPGGRVALVAGDRVTIALDGGALVTVPAVRLPGDVAADPAAVSDLARQAVNNADLVPAGSVRIEGDRVVLGAAEGLAIHSGTIDVSAPPGGSAGRVQLLSGSTAISAPGSRIHARGGDGFVEISGARSVLARGDVDLAAPGGRAGTYLIDPAVLRIVEVDAGVNTVTRSQLEAQGPGSRIVLQADDRIVVEPLAAPVTLQDDVSLTLATRTGDIVFEQPVSSIHARGTGAITIAAGLEGFAHTDLGDLRTDAGDITITTSWQAGTITVRSLTSASGKVALNGAFIFDDGDQSTRITAPTITLDGGDVGLRTPGMDIDIGAGTLRVAGTQAFLAALGAVTLERVLVQDRFEIVAGGTITLGSITAPAGAGIESSGGSVVAAGGSGTNLQVAAFPYFDGGHLTQSAILAAGTVGTAAKPLAVQIGKGTLSVRAGSAVAGVSVNVNGTVAPGDRLEVQGTPPGRVIFNGVTVSGGSTAEIRPAGTREPAPTPVPEVAPPVAGSTVRSVLRDGLQAADPAQQARLDTGNTDFSASAFTGAHLLDAFRDRTLDLTVEPIDELTGSDQPGDGKRRTVPAAIPRRAVAGKEAPVPAGGVLTGASPD